MNELIHPFLLVANAIDRDPRMVSEESEMYKDHGWDSLGHLAVLTSMEREYGIEINDETVQKYKKMREILRCYENLKKVQEDSD